MIPGLAASLDATRLALESGDAVGASRLAAEAVAICEAHRAEGGLAADADLDRTRALLGACLQQVEGLKRDLSRSLEGAGASRRALDAYGA